MAKKDKSLIDLSKVKGSFLDAIKSKYVEQHAETALAMIEDRDRLKKAYEKLEKWCEALEGGDISVLKKYKKFRTKMEEIEDYEED